MTTTHSFNDDENYAKGGQWFDDYGGRICVWRWDAPSKVLTVECGCDSAVSWMADTQAAMRIYNYSQWVAGNATLLTQ